MYAQKPMLFTGSASRKLAEAIAEQIGIEIADAMIDTFSDGETRVKINDNVRGKDVFILQSTGYPPNHNYMELFVTLDALRRASAGRITAVIPYFGYARQDRKDQPRVPITAKLVANLLTAAGADRVMTLDLHAHQIQGFFDIPLDHIYAVNVFIDYLKENLKVKNPVVVATDAGAAKMAAGYAKRLNCDMAIIDKRRVDDKNTKAMHVLGDVDGKDAIIVDDIIATAGSIVSGAQVVKEHGANRVIAAVTHGVLSGPAIERIDSSVLERLIVTDSIEQTEAKKHNKIDVISIDKLFAEAISRVHDSQSISTLFNQ